jgi:hypothetical protein
VQVIDVDLPITVIVKVVETDPGLKGDTAQGIFLWSLSFFALKLTCSNLDFL